jgi:hypothetical protein
LVKTLEPPAAEPQLRALYAECVQALGPGHWLTVSCHEDLATTLDALGRGADARAERRRLLGVLERPDGSVGDDTPGGRHQRAYLLTSVGRLDEAEREWRRVLDSYVADLGVDHPHTLRARHGIAWVDIERGLLPAARQRLEPLADAFGRVLGPDHPWTRSCLDDLARLTDRDGQ